jgi:ABC-type lipoprotein export system ATPase subunit
MALLEDLHRSHGLTSVYVTHNLTFARRADRILKIERGSLTSNLDIADPSPAVVSVREDGFSG